MTYFGRMAKHDFTVAQRDKDAKSGAAMGDGSYPIKSKQDLKNAIRLSGMSDHSDSAVRAHIKARAKAIGAEGLIPDDWK